jgi:hypothetical protein
MMNLHKLQKDDHIIGLKTLALRKIGLAVLAKLESKLELIIIPRTS